MSGTVEEIEYFPILISSYRFEEMSTYARKAGCTALVLMIPLAMIKPHEKQAVRNHSQSLARLSARGGLSAAEAVAVLEDRPYETMSFGASHTRLLAMHFEWSAAQFIASKKSPSTN